MDSDDEYMIMNILDDDAPNKASPGNVRGMLQDLRRFLNEHDSNPGSEKFDDWSEGYTARSYASYFGSWNGAVEAAGGEPNDKNAPVSKDEALQAVGNASEQRLEYKIDGTEHVSPEGEAPPASHLQHIDSVDNLVSHQAFVQKLDEDDTYTQAAIRIGYDTAAPPSTGSGPSDNPDYDWDEVYEKLKEAIEEEVYWRARDTWIPEDEIPSNIYIKQREDLPSLTALKGRLGPREEWPQELGLEEERNANDLPDPSKFGL
jgi:hypothetical protein